MTKKILINFSNHPAGNWDEKQKEGWDEIIDIQFPQIDPLNYDISETTHKYIELIKSIADKKLKNDIYAKIYLSMQGEYSLCYSIILKLHKYIADSIYLAIPQSKRNVVESNGTKTVKFDFIKWLIIDYDKL